MKDYGNEYPCEPEPFTPQEIAIMTIVLGLCGISVLAVWWM